MNTPTKPVEQKARELPMVDIEERLRTQVARVQDVKRNGPIGAGLQPIWDLVNMAPEAADEIARLKAEIADMKAARDLQRESVRHSR